MRDANAMPPPTATVKIQPTDPKRLKGFATFFKNYMSISTVVVAAAPIPITAARLIPTFDAQRGTITTLSSSFSPFSSSHIYFFKLV